MGGRSLINVLLTVTLFVTITSVEADSWLYTSSDTNKTFNAFWYVPPSVDNNTIKIEFQATFDKPISSSNVFWVGIGFRVPEASDAMGIGQFYTGQSDSLKVTARYISTITSTKPSAVNVSDILDSGCTVANNDSHTLVCYLLRNITTSGSAKQTSVDLAQDVQLMWAHGPVTNHDIAFHTHYGITPASQSLLDNDVKGISLTTTAPSPLSFSKRDVTISWMPLPGNSGSIDFYMSMNTSNEKVNASACWMGIGLGLNAAGMGPAEFYTGQSDSLVVTDRFLASGVGFPPRNNDSDLTSSSCAIDHSNGMFACTFSRPLEATANNQVDLSSEETYIKYACGNVASSGEIEMHIDTGVSTSKYNFASLPVPPAPGPVPVPAPSTPAPSKSPVPSPNPQPIAREKWLFLNKNESFGAFWYRPPYRDNKTLKIQFSAKLPDITSANPYWVGLGLRVPRTTAGMGPGQFYVGQSDTLSITPRYLVTGNMLPPVAKVSDIIDSGCSVQASSLVCWLVRNITASSDAAQYSIDLAADVEMMWAYGTVVNGVPQYHDTNFGVSSVLNLPLTGAHLPTVPGRIQVSWMPLPGDGSLDFYMNSNFEDLNLDPRQAWVGVGVSTSIKSMGPGEFYTGQGDTLVVSDRYLGSGVGYPPRNTKTDIINSSCIVLGTGLSCQFNRFLELTQIDQVNLWNQSVYLKMALGPLSNGDIDIHTFTTITEEPFNLSSVSGHTPIPPPRAPQNQLYKAHGTLMIIAWLFLLPYGIYVARFRNTMGLGKYPDLKGPPMWWRLHQPLQYTGVAIMTAGIVCIFLKAGWMTPTYLSATHSHGLHEILGIISFALTLSQPVFAIVRNGFPSCSKEKQHQCHHIWHWIHGIAGYGALGTALVAVGIGIEEYTLQSKWPPWFIAGYTTSCGALVIFSIYGFARVLLCSKPQTVHTNNHSQLLLEPATDNNEAENPLKGQGRLVWILFVLLFGGAIMCAVALITSTARG